MNENQQTFLNISVSLTGFNEAELLGTGMLATYYNTIVESISASDFDLFLSAAASILNASEKRVNKEISLNLMPDSSYNGLAKKIITMWYTGNWGDAVISPESYVQGLIWKAAQTHPPGAKQPGYGSWANPPIQIPNK